MLYVIEFGWSVSSEGERQSRRVTDLSCIPLRNLTHVVQPRTAQPPPPCLTASGISRRVWSEGRKFPQAGHERCFAVSQCDNAPRSYLDPRATSAPVDTLRLCILIADLGDGRPADQAMCWELGKMTAVSDQPSLAGI